ncbi:universal stress protein [Streptomyces sp. S.PB5]|uniref:universal stress protein n=1 Tax=Streptomyces sp. S.PB5 TaxID=3020844 RepID=UPI0025B06D9E|nr:universal stress protein [Streptomyces sp. S.PB5]MDN3029187.1 universal stress protein [Streptomyces sp. S.PB5]
MTQHADDTIVVGVDGSEASLAALRWAERQARALEAQVVAVHAWEPAAARFAPYAPAVGRPTAEEQREQAAELLAATVRKAFGARSGSAVRAVVAEGPPAGVLLRHARDALLLALGRKAHGQWEAPAIGTVGRECLRHATVPVVTVPAAGRSAPPLRAVAAHERVGSGAA